MKVAFFTEGGGSKGLGHLVRCKALAEEFLKRGFEVLFFVEKSGSIPSFLGSFGDTNWDDGLRCEGIDIAVVDSYSASCDIAKNAKTVLFFDDFNRDVYERGFVLNAAAKADILGYEERVGITYLLGLKYVILRNEFAKQKYRKKPKKISKLLLSFGGADNKNAATKISNYLSKKHPNLTLTVVGRKKFIGAKKFRELMYASDIGIFSCSQTLYEASSTSLPSIGVLTEQNQQSLCKGAANSIDFGDRFFFYRLEKRLARVANTSYRAIDTKGAARVADILTKDALSKNEITFTNILECDEDIRRSLREWRNQPFIKEQMTTTHEISEAEHTAWLASLQNNNSKKTFVAFLGDTPFGVCNLAFDGEFGFYVFDKNLLGFGLGYRMCDEFLKLMLGSGDIKTVKSRVIKSNEKSLGLHKKLGFCVYDEDEQNYFLRKTDG
jgi:UDP-4-amino-4,6-dideoxy-N-acetyl-beta-L-altrosamine N-acetyltransferase